MIDGAPAAIRPGGEQDLDTIARIAVESWVSTGLALEGESSVEERRNRFAHQIAAGCALFLAEHEGEVVGFVMFDVADGYLAQLFVAPRSQRTGIGRALLRLALSRMPAGAWLKTPADNRFAIAWYEREGFLKEREVDQPPHRSVAYFRWRAPEA